MKMEETPQELVTRLQDLAVCWTRECKTAEELLNLIVKEQLLKMLPEDVRVWVTEQKSKTSSEAGELADPPRPTSGTSHHRVSAQSVDSQGTGLANALILRWSGSRRRRGRRLQPTSQTANGGT